MKYIKNEICSIYKSIHIKKHYIINYKTNNYIYKKYNKKSINYSKNKCKLCKKK